MDGSRGGVSIGTALAAPSPQDAAEVEALRAVLPWLEYYGIAPEVRDAVQRRLSATAALPAHEEAFAIPDWALQRHAAIFGASGFGKTTLASRMIACQLEGGASLVAISPKVEDVLAMRAACEDALMDPEDVILIDAERPETAPGLNPFDSGAKPGTNAKTVTDILARAGAFTGDRMEVFLLYAIKLAAWHRLSLIDVRRILIDQPFRESVLASPPACEPGIMYGETVEFFRKQFDQYRQSERDVSVLAAMGKFSKMLASEVILRMFRSRRNKVDFGALFRRRGAILVNVDTTGDTDIAEAGAALLAGIVVQMLFSAAGRRQEGGVPVVLYVDEFGAVAGPISETLKSVVNRARVRDIRLLLSAQHPDQMPEDLRKDVMISSAVKAYFFPGDHAAAVPAARSLAATGASERDEHVVRLGPVRTVWTGELTAVRIGDERQGLRPLEADRGRRLPQGALPVDPYCPGEALKAFTGDALPIRPPVCFANGQRASEGFAQLPEGWAWLSWKGGRGYAEVRMPVPELRRERSPGMDADDWVRTLMRLGRGEAVVAVGNEPPRKVRVDYAPPRADASAAFVERSERAGAALEPEQPATGPGEFPAPEDETVLPEEIPEEIPAEDPTAPDLPPTPSRRRKRKRTGGSGSGGSGGAGEDPYGRYVD